VVGERRVRNDPPDRLFRYSVIVHLWGAARQINPPCPPLPRTCSFHQPEPNLLGTLYGVFDGVTFPAASPKFFALRVRDTEPHVIAGVGRA
jgi:hypothetical protein